MVNIAGLGEYEHSPYGDIMKMSENLAEQNPLRYSSCYYDDTRNTSTTTPAVNAPRKNSYEPMKKNRP